MSEREQVLRETLRELAPQAAGLSNNEIVAACRKAVPDATEGEITAALLSAADEMAQEAAQIEQGQQAPSVH